MAKNLPEIKAKKHNDFVKIAKTSVWDKYWRGHKSDHDDKLHWDAWWAIMGTNTSGWTKSPPMKPGLKEEWDKAMKGAKKG